MRIYAEPMEMIKEIERDLYEMGHRYQSATVQDQDVADNPDFETIELFGYAYTLKSWTPVTLMYMIEYISDDPDYKNWIYFEKKERVYQSLANKNPGSAWKHRREFWEQFLRNGVFAYSYAERWQEQIPYVIRELKAKPNTRQAIITMYDRHQDMLSWGGKDRVPCSLTYQFYIRDGRLGCIYNQRSCDFVKFFVADVIFTLYLLDYISRELNIDSGEFIHFLGSLHAFAGDLKGKDIF